MAPLKRLDVHPVREQESTLEAGRERDEALQQLDQEHAQLQAVAQSQERMAQQLDALSQELAATRQQLQQSQVNPCSLALPITFGLFWLS